MEGGGGCWRGGGGRGKESKTHIVKYSKCVGGRGEMYDIQEWSQPVSCPMKCFMLSIYGGMLVSLSHSPSLNQPQGI